MSKLLPHEIGLLKEALKTVNNQLKDLANEKAEAQGPAYDWHDNAPLDAVGQEQGIVGGKRNSIEQHLREAEVAAYPDPTSTRIALGSLVMARDSWGDIAFLVVGQRLVGQDAYKEGLERELALDADDISIVTPAGPLGAAALGAAVGDVISYPIDEDRNASISVTDINQTWLAANFAPDQA
jgi:transcription elongation GreA/GreB family factor